MESNNIQQEPVFDGNGLKWFNAYKVANKQWIEIAELAAKLKEDKRVLLEALKSLAGIEAWIDDKQMKYIYLILLIFIFSSCSHWVTYERWTKIQMRKSHKYWVENKKYLIKHVPTLSN